MFQKSARKNEVEKPNSSESKSWRRGDQQVEKTWSMAVTTMRGSFSRDHRKEKHQQGLPYCTYFLECYALA